jgi:hypothetical protein
MPQHNTGLLFVQLNVHVYPFRVFQKTRKIHLKTQISNFKLTAGIAKTGVSHDWNSVKEIMFA